jgi:hypothetical protein
VTAYHLVSIGCDALNGDCDAELDGAGSTVAEARRIARDEGWVYRRGKDLCPQHADLTTALQDSFRDR